MKLQADDLSKLLAEESTDILLIENWFEFITLLLFVKDNDGIFDALTYSPSKTATEVEGWLSGNENILMLKAEHDESHVSLRVSPAVVHEETLRDIKKEIGCIRFPNQTNKSAG
jgi:hypothetical protein